MKMDDWEVDRLLESPAMKRADRNLKQAILNDEDNKQLEKNLQQLAKGTSALQRLQADHNSHEYYNRVNERNVSEKINKTLKAIKVIAGWVEAATEINRKRAEKVNRRLEKELHPAPALEKLRRRFDAEMAAQSVSDNDLANRLKRLKLK